MKVRMKIQTIWFVLVSALVFVPICFGQERQGGGGQGTAQGLAQRGNNDFSLLPNAVRARLRQLDGKYGADEWRHFNVRNPIAVEAMGNSKTVQEPHEKLLYRCDLLKTVFSKDDAGGGFVLSYYSNGCVNSYAEYKAGNFHGAFVKFHENGKLKCYLECRDGNPVGDIEQWDEAGVSLGAVEIRSPREFIVNISTNN